MTDKKMTEAEHQAVFDYYDNMLKELGPGKTIGPEEEEALEGAFYHAKMLFEAPELFDWFIERTDPFLRVAAWKLLTSLYEEMLEILKNTSPAPGGLEFVRILNRLAFLCRSMGEYEKALSYYEQALKILDKLYFQRCMFFRYQAALFVWA